MSKAISCHQLIAFLYREVLIQRCHGRQGADLYRELLIPQCHGWQGADLYTKALIQRCHGRQRVELNWRIYPNISWRVIPILLTATLVFFVHSIAIYPRF